MDNGPALVQEEHCSEGRKRKSRDELSTTSSSSSSSSSSSDCSRKRRRKNRNKKKKNGKLTKLISEIAEIKSHLCQQTAVSYPQYDEDILSIYDTSNTRSEFDHVDDRPSTSTAHKIEEEHAFSVPIKTITKEPTIPSAPPAYLDELKTLQHFDQPDWNKVRYSDTQKLYSCSPGFVSLETNDEARRVDHYNTAFKMEGTFASMIYALLKQRDALYADVKGLVQSTKQSDNTDIGSKLNDIFQNGEYAKITSDIFQMVCGHRAEMIQNRRESIINTVKDPYLKNTLRKIPPSATNLFNSEKFSLAIEKAGGALKVFSPFPPHKERSYASYNTTGFSNHVQKQPNKFQGKPAPTMKTNKLKRFLPNERFRTREGNPKQQGRQHEQAPKRHNSPSSRRDRRDNYRKF